MKIDTNISHLEWTDITGIFVKEMGCASEASFSCRIDAIRLVAKVEDRTARDVTAVSDGPCSELTSLWQSLVRYFSGLSKV
jgi:hypothetical protein